MKLNFLPSVVVVVVDVEVVVELEVVEVEMVVVDVEVVFNDFQLRIQINCVTFNSLLIFQNVCSVRFCTCVIKRSWRCRQQPSRRIVL